MLKRMFTILLCGLLFETLLAADAWALQPAGPLANPQTARLRSTLERVGAGSNTLVAIRLRDKSVISGFVANLGPDSVQVVDANTGAASTVPWRDVSRLAATNLVSGETVQYGGGIKSKLAKAIALVVPGRQVAANRLFGLSPLLIGIIIGILLAIILAKTL
jgi:hypothetical protein